MREAAQNNSGSVLSAASVDVARGGACVEGILASSTPYFAVIDADMQHDEGLLPQMLERLKRTDLDVVVGSRYVEGGGVDTGMRRVSASAGLPTSSALSVKG